MNKIGTFNESDGGKNDLFLFGVIVQSVTDGLIPRGGNFLTNGMVSSEHTHLQTYLEDTFTESGGLFQPETNIIPIPIGYKLAWFADVKYNVTGYIYLKEAIPYSDTYFKTKEEAEAKIKPIVRPPVIEPPQLSDGNFRLGQVGIFYDTKYEDLLQEVQDGVSKFSFFGQINASYPTFNIYQNRFVNKLAVIDMPSHSIICKKELIHLKSKIHYKLIDNSNNELVLEVFDTKSGIHPALKANSRGNNHPDDVKRWVKQGSYTFEAKNISEDDVTQTWLWGWIRTNNGIAEIYQLKRGESLSKTIVINEIDDKFDMLKFNCNVI